MIDKYFDTIMIALNSIILCITVFFVIGSIRIIKTELKGLNEKRHSSK
jgi:hypothetical protein